MARSAVLNKVRLYTCDGHFVVAGEIPAFNEWPAVLSWGMRMFRFDREDASDNCGIYREAFYVALVEVNDEKHDDLAE